MKKLYAKFKTGFDAYKMYVFFMALLFGTNGAQMYVNHEPEPVEPLAVKPVANVVKSQTTIIYKTDNSYCDKKMNEHTTGSQH